MAGEQSSHYPGKPSDADMFGSTISENRAASTNSNTNGVSDSLILDENQLRYADVRLPTEGLTEQIGVTTKNVTDADVVVSKKSEYVPIDKNLFSATTGVEQSLKDFLSKPTIVQSGNLTPADSVGSFSVLPVLTTVLRSPIYFPKLQGYLGIRCKVVFRLQVNANPFQAGRYLLCFVPTMGSNPLTANTVRYIDQHRFSLMQRTQLPHVELDLNCDTEAVLEIPFSSVESMFSIASLTPVNGFSDIGVFFIAPYVPVIAVAGSTTVSYTLWAHLEDVELFGAVIPQSGGRQSGERELKSKNLGPISSSLRNVSLAANIISEIPLLSNFAQMTSFFADVGARAANVFGYSKPLSLDAPSYMIRNVFPNSVNVDGINACKQLAFSEKNQLEVIPGFAGSAFDELSIDYIKTIPSYFNVTSWGVGRVADETIATFDLNPQFFKNTNVDSGLTVTSFTPIAWLSNFFGLYRGSIVFRFKIVKTCFHSGRLVVAFNNYDPRFIAPAYGNVNSSYIHREIIDIREGNEFTIAVPYTANQNYLRANQSFGRLVISVLDPLKAPATVSDTIYIVAEVWGGEDLEFAAPQSLDYEPYLPTVAQSGKDPCDLTTTVIGGSRIVPTDLHARACIGERIISLRSLLKPAVALYNYDTTWFATNALNFRPYNIQVSYPTGAGILTRPRQTGDFISMIASAYSTLRGSVCYYIDIDQDVRYVASTDTTNGSYDNGLDCYYNPGVGAGDVRNYLRNEIVRETIQTNPGAL